MINLTTRLIQEMRSLSIRRAVYGFGVTVCFCHPTRRLTLFSQMYPQLIWSHRSCISFTASGQSSMSCSLWSWSYLSCDVITWRLCPWQYQCQINPPRHDITSAGSALTSTACLCDPSWYRHCCYEVSDVGQSSAAGGPQWGSEPGLSGSEGKRGC